MKIPNKNPIVISNPCALACVMAVRNLLSKDHVPVRFLDSPSSRFPRNDNNVFRRFFLYIPGCLIANGNKRQTYKPDGFFPTRRVKTRFKLGKSEAQACG